MLKFLYSVKRPKDIRINQEAHQAGRRNPESRPGMTSALPQSGICLECPKFQQFPQPILSKTFPDDRKAMSSTSSMNLDDLIQEFDDLGDWADQCELLIDIGRDLPPFPDEFRTEENKVHGCQSNVWMVADVSESDPPRIELRADSDAMLVKGLLTIILMTYSGRTADEILSIDIQRIFQRLGLHRHLSTARKNGLAGMVKRVREIAARVRS